ncbi:MAG: hypothetical protein AAF619_07310 [Pseudomonadota bacterium]
MTMFDVLRDKQIRLALTILFTLAVVWGSVAHAATSFGPTTDAQGWSVCTSNATGDEDIPGYSHEDAACVLCRSDWDGETALPAQASITEIALYSCAIPGIHAVNPHDTQKLSQISARGPPQRF